MEKKPIKVLILDDSEFFCEMISLHLSRQPEIEVVGTANNAKTALRLIEELKPDVLTVDIEMPDIDGIEFTRQVVRRIPVPIVMLSAADYRVFEAMEAGAVDFVLKPESANLGATGFMSELLVKIRIAAASTVQHKKQVIPVIPPKFIDKGQGTSRGNTSDFDYAKIVAIGASTGGTEAIIQVLKSIPKGFPPIVIAQHIPHSFSKIFAERADLVSEIKVKEAVHGEELKPGTAYIAPGEYQMSLQKANDRIFIKCDTKEKVSGFAPSVDALFESVANIYGKNSVGVILTGMGKDGVRGLLKIRATGGYTIGQDEETSVIYGMPKVAYEVGAVVGQLSIYDISAKLVNLLKR